MSVWAVVVAVVGGVGGVVASAFAARATVRAARTTAEAARAAAQLQAEPSQRAADLAAFQAIRDDMEQEIGELREEQGRMRSLVHAFAGYVVQLTAQMRSHGVEPPAPPARVDEYNRTGA